MSLRVLGHPYPFLQQSTNPLTCSPSLTTVFEEPSVGSRKYADNLITEPWLLLYSKFSLNSLWAVHVYLQKHWNSCLASIKGLSFESLLILEESMERA